MKQEINRRKSDVEILKHIFNVKLLRADANTGFKFLENINRGIVPAHVTKLSESLKMLGFLQPIIVFLIDLPKHNLVGKYIGDGQHRFMAALRNSMDIPYVEVKISSVTEMVEYLALLNNSSKSWSLADYVQAWSCINPEYKKLAQYHELYDLELSCVAGILHESHTIFSSFNIIKDGSLKIKNEEKAVMYLDYVSDFVSALPKIDRSFSRKVINAYHYFLLNNQTTYNHSKFIKNLKKKSESFSSINGEDFTEFFEQLM
jgi:hypothetical protein